MPLRNLHRICNYLASTVLNYLGEWPRPYLFLLDLLALGIMSACYGLYRIAAAFLLLQLPANDSH